MSAEESLEECRAARERLRQALIDQIVGQLSEHPDADPDSEAWCSKAEAAATIIANEVEIGTEKL